MSSPNRRMIASRPRVPGATASRASTSASIVGTPSDSKRALTWLLPVAMPPVSPTRRTTTITHVLPSTNH
jgi:hypothetical protein